MPKHVLVVEDQSELRQIVCLFLNQLFKVVIHEAENGQQALDILQNERNINLIISDLNMPVLNGIDMTKAIRADKFNKDIPIIMLTSEGEEYREIATEIGVTEFFNKPMQPEFLMPEVEKYLS